MANYKASTSFGGGQKKATAIVTSQTDGVLRVAFGGFAPFSDEGVTLAATDTIEVCVLPEGATIIGGFIEGNDIDTNGTPTLELDVGWRIGTGSLSSTQLLNSGVITGDVVTGFTPEGGFHYPFTLPRGGKLCTAETDIVVTVTGAPATQNNNGYFNVAVFYLDT